MFPAEIVVDPFYGFRDNTPGCQRPRKKSNRNRDRGTLLRDCSRSNEPDSYAITNKGHTMSRVGMKKPEQCRAGHTMSTENIYWDSKHGVAYPVCRTCRLHVPGNVIEKHPLRRLKEMS